jgi:hypothetical protein
MIDAMADHPNPARRRLLQAAGGALLVSPRAAFLILATVAIMPCMAQSPRTPDVEAQRAAMKKLSFLIGKWSGSANVLRGPDRVVELAQTEEAQYRLDGLLLVIEGIGKSKTDGQPALQALGVISYDDANSSYKMRAFNDGRWLETEVRLEGERLTWSFTLGDFKTNSTLQINQRGEWTEHAELTIGSQPPRKLMDLAVKREQ